MKTIALLLCAIMLCSFSNTHCFVKVSAEFEECYNGYRSGVNVLQTATDTAGNIYVSSNALNEFPELFDTMRAYQIVWLPIEAFRADSIGNQ